VEEAAARSTKPNIDANVLQAKIDAQGVHHALNASDRYAIRLPKPEAYVASSTERSRAGSAYPPAASTEKDYVVTVSLRYRVGTFSGFRLTGRPDDNGPFNPFPVETPIINFAIQPLPGHMMDACNLHAREAFRHHSYISPVAAGIVVGFGIDGYLLAIDALVRRTRAARK